MKQERVTIPARKGTSVALTAGQKLRVENTFGSQVLDTWAFSAADFGEYMAMEATRSWNSRLTPAVGDVLVSNRYRPMLKLVEDTTPGVHDTLMCCCSPGIYAKMGYPAHDNCEDNFHAALKAIGRDVDFTPGPLNLFMNFPVAPDGQITREPPVSKPGDYVVFEALVDVVVVFSACPQDISAVNGAGRMPTDAHYTVFGDAK